MVSVLPLTWYDIEFLSLPLWINFNLPAPPLPRFNVDAASGAHDPAGDPCSRNVRSIDPRITSPAIFSKGSGEIRALKFLSDI